MEFDKGRVYTALNADEVKPGSMVVLADTAKRLKDNVAFNVVTVLDVIDDDDDSMYRFRDINGSFYAFCYLVSEPKKPRRMTNRELARWLAQGNGQWLSSNSAVDTSYSYGYGRDECELPEGIKICGWDEEEWHEPVVKEVDE